MTPKFMPCFWIPDSYLMFPQHVSWMLESHLTLQLRSWFRMNSPTPPPKCKTNKEKNPISPLRAPSYKMYRHSLSGSVQKSLESISWFHSVSQTLKSHIQSINQSSWFCLQNTKQSDNFSPSLTVSPNHHDFSFLLECCSRFLNGLCISILDFLGSTCHYNYSDSFTKSV